MESATVAPGDELFVPIDTPFGRLGLFVCYELRFPEVAREQVAAGAEVLLVPSGWVRGPMKEYHWQSLVTTRAIENTAFVVACDQVSDYYCGRSMVVDPLGVAMVTGGEEEQILLCDIDLDRIRSVRKKLPSYSHRRPTLYKALRNEASVQ
jgi:predicted amidohydrolase